MDLKNKNGVSEEDIAQRLAASYELPNNVLNAVPKPLVSIRTSTYQHGPYIKECIEGVLSQKTDFPFEYIIGEDFSTDGTREIVFEYAKKYPDIIRVITADFNVGMKANGRRCYRAMRGEYQAVCEGDDYWTDPLKLQKQVDLLEGKPHCTVCAHNVLALDAEGGEAVCWKTPRDDEYELDDLLRHHFVATCSLLIRIDSMKITPLSSPGGDVFVVANALRHGNLACINDVMAVYRNHEGGMHSSLSQARRCLFALGNRRVLVEQFGKRTSLVICMFNLYKAGIVAAIATGEMTTARAIAGSYTQYVWQKFPVCFWYALASYFPAKLARNIQWVHRRFRRDRI